MGVGVIFDLDGVLTDTVELHYRSWRRLADELGFSFPRSANDALRGRSRRDALEIFLDGRRVAASPEALMDRKNRYFLEEAEGIGPEDLAPGALDLLDGLRAAGARLALASASRNARFVCERLEIVAFFDVLADGHSVSRPKPAPDIFLWAAGGLGLTPRCCTVIEDAAAGVDAALAGGFRVVGLGPSSRVGAAHMVADDLASLAPPDLLASQQEATGTSLPRRTAG